MNANAGFSPCTRTTGLSSALFPTGTDSCGRFGSRSISWLRAASASAACLSSCRDPVAQVAGFLLLRLGLGGLLLPHQRADFLGHAVALGLERFDLAQQLAPLLVAA